MRTLLLLAALLSTTPALGQQEPTPAEHAMAAKILQEVQAGLSCSALLFSMKVELDNARAKIKDLEAKANAKPAAIGKP